MTGWERPSGFYLRVLYADDGMVGSREPDWMQHLMKDLVGLFQRYGLADNVAKSHTMTYQPGILWSGMLEEAKALKCTVVGDLYLARLRRSIPCPECGVDITAGSMMENCQRLYGTELTMDWSWLPVRQISLIGGYQLQAVPCHPFIMPVWQPHLCF